MYPWNNSLWYIFTAFDRTPPHWISTEKQTNKQSSRCYLYMQHALHYHLSVTEPRNHPHLKFQLPKKTTVPDKLQYSAKINQYAHDNPLSLDSNKKVRHTETYSSLSKGITAFPDHHLTFLLTNPSANPSACEAATDNTVSAVRAFPNNCNVHAGFP